MKRLLFIFTLLVFNLNLFSQDIPGTFLNEELIRAELDSRGFEDISIDEMKSRLTAKGVDLENLNPSQTEELQDKIDEVFAEIQAEKDSQNKPKEEIKADERKEDKAQKEDKREDDALDDEIEEDAFEISDVERRELIYGQGVFLDKKLKNYFKHNDVKPPSTYLLGEGDELIVNIFGTESQLSSSFEIEDGYIQPDDMERIYLKGMTFGQAKKILKQRFSQYYRFANDDFNVALNFSRNITVNIVGEVREIGAYTIPALNSAFSALVAAKGISKNGSVRRIRVIRDGQAPIKFDLYKYLMEPTSNKNLFLQNNDFISVPTLGKVIVVEGAVRRPHKYELTDSENLKKLVYWAGGFKGNAYKKNIKIVRFEDDEEKIINVDFRALEKQGKDFKLLHGDQVSIPFIPVNYDNFVSIEGAVNLEGQFEYTNGMRLSDLVYKGVLSDSARIDIAYLFRKRPDSRNDYIQVDLLKALENPGSTYDIKLQPKDRLNVFFSEEFLEKSKVLITGAIRNPNTYPHVENLKLSDIVTLSGGLKETSTGRAYIFRKKAGFEQREYIGVNIREIMEDPNASNDVLLEPSDSIVVFSYSKFFETASTVSIEGAVLEENTFPYSSNMTLKDLLELSGGLKLSADNAKINVYRVKIESGEQTITEELELEIDDEYNVLGEQSGNFMLKPYDQIQVRYTPDFELQQTVVINGEVRYPGPYSIVKANEKISDIIRRAGGYKESAFKEGATLYRGEGGLGYLVVDEVDLLDEKNSPSNYILRDGDVITIPKQINLVTIQGFTNANESLAGGEVSGNRVNVPYQKGKTAKYYIDKYAGGIDRDAGAKTRLIKVKQPGGSLERTKDYGFFKKYPVVQKGAVIIVDRKVKTEEERDREKVDWGDVISNTVAQATAILTLVILIQQIQ